MSVCIRFFFFYYKVMSVDDLSTNAMLPGWYTEYQSNQKIHIYKAECNSGKGMKSMENIFMALAFLFYRAVTCLCISWVLQLNYYPVSCSTFQFLVWLVRRTAEMLVVQKDCLCGSSAAQKGKCPGSQGSWNILR